MSQMGHPVCISKMHPRQEPGRSANFSTTIPLSINIFTTARRLSLEINCSTFSASIINFSILENTLNLRTNPLGAYG